MSCGKNRNDCEQVFGVPVRAGRHEADAGARLVLGWGLPQPQRPPVSVPFSHASLPAPREPSPRSTVQRSADICRSSGLELVVPQQERVRRHVDRRGAQPPNPAVGLVGAGDQHPRGSAGVAHTPRTATARKAVDDIIATQVKPSCAEYEVDVSDILAHKGDVDWDWAFLVTRDDLTAGTPRCAVGPEGVLALPSGQVLGALDSGRGPVSSS
ncbi:hypothetical protein CEUSTIGMA_g13689.t1 [Chlamydomonas eustigma]|uniref:Uncharacterized protein n=1 Tax=Chlamydomonas eustigma TaxID=1157962 RepID=A0A250XT75_9CHLO|nr:hypothetical protein CEUSTIGMA_g13689.t1 [Chlamydomonas eustigma]|eukprot:GAX86277.1 hypothetical protein CEUSTIGMA_g13689.t1 [Chlamydomonas eustigma]